MTTSSNSPLESLTARTIERLAKQVAELNQEPMMVFVFEDEEVDALIDILIADETDAAIKAILETGNAARLKIAKTNATFLQSVRDGAFDLLNAWATGDINPTGGMPIGFVPPSWWDDFLMYLMPNHCRPAIMISGPAGNGKTTTAEAACQVLGYRYRVIDCTADMLPPDLVGDMDFNPQSGSFFRKGLIAEAFESGDAVILNEIDVLPGRTLMALQSAMQRAGRNSKGRYLTTKIGRIYPNGDCPLIFTSNTVGNGGNVEYNTRSMLDSASIDRMTVITTGYENEKLILAGNGYSPTNIDKVYDWAVRMRETVAKTGERVVISNRLMINMCEAIELHGRSFDEAVEKEFYRRLDVDVLKSLKPTGTVPAFGSRF